MRQAQTFDFHFKNVEKQYESYQGINVKLRYAYSSCPVCGTLGLILGTANRFACLVRTTLVDTLCG